MIDNETKITVEQKNNKALPKELKEIKEKYLNSGILKNWVNERTLLSPEASAFDRLKEKYTTEVGAERRTRASIVLAIKADLKAAERGFPKEKYDSGVFGWPQSISYVDYGLHSDIFSKKSEISSAVDTLLSIGGPNTETVSQSWGVNELFGYQQIETESSKGEKTIVKIGRRSDDRKYYAQEINSRGELVTEAIFDYGDEFNSTHLKLHNSSSGIDISTGGLPRTTMKVFDSLVGVMVKSSGKSNTRNKI